MALGRLAGQFAALDELRSRVGVVLSGASIATGFLAGQALTASTGIPGPAWLGIGSAVLLVCCCAAILWPRNWAGMTQHASAIVADVRAVPDREMGAYYTAIAEFADAAADANLPKLRDLYRVFAVSLTLLMLDFAGWIWTLALNNGSH